MEAVLHIEPINRPIHAPIRIGHSDYLYYGEKLTDDEENVGTVASNIKLGCPLETLDYGSTRSHIPLVKTIECTPDLSRDSGYVYTENIHYLKDRKFLIPVRSKIRSGLGQGLRLTHLPSLNFIRQDVTGDKERICDPRSDIVSEILLRDNSHNQPLRDWIGDDLITSLSWMPSNQLSFDTADCSRMIRRYMDQLYQTPSELTHYHLNNIESVIYPEKKSLPLRYSDHHEIINPVLHIRNRMINSDVDFKPFGYIPIRELSRIDYNPSAFRSICEIIDRVPLTDFNVELLVGEQGSIDYYHENVALDRFSAFDDYDGGICSGESVLREYLTESVLHSILEKFLRYHSEITDEIEDLIYHHRVKLKIIKTITDEAAVLLYNEHSTPVDSPLCGVYFDIALQSLAPMSIIPEPISN